MSPPPPPPSPPPPSLRGRRSGAAVVALLVSAAVGQTLAFDISSTPPPPLLLALTDRGDKAAGTVVLTAEHPCWVKQYDYDDDDDDDIALRSGSGSGSGATTTPLAGCAFGGGVTLDAPLPSGLKEASGVSASGQYPGRLYAVDDGGALYTLDANNNSGAVLGVYRLPRGEGEDGDDGGKKKKKKKKRGSEDMDWEDVAVAREPLSPRRWKVFVGDIGNNEGRRRTVRVFRFEEPPPPPPPPPSVVSVEGGTAREDILIDAFDTIRLEYPKDAKEEEDGRGVGGGDTTAATATHAGGGYPDAETLIVDSHCGDIFIITKERKKWVKARVYRARYPYSVQKKNKLELVGRLGFSLSGPVVGGDVTQSGDELLLKTPAEVLYYRRGAPRVKPQPYVREAQGEAVGFAADGSGYYTLSEQRRRRKKNNKYGKMSPLLPNALTFHPRRGRL